MEKRGVVTFVAVVSVASSPGAWCNSVLCLSRVEVSYPPPQQRGTTTLSRSWK